MKKVKIQISEERHCQDLESFGSIFIPIIRNNTSAEDLLEADVLHNWEKIVGKDLASFCNPLKCKYNVKDSCRTLFVEVPLGGFALELQHKESYILEKINSYFGYKAFHKMNIAQNGNINLRKIKMKKQEIPPELKEEEKKYLMEITEGIKDEKLRKTLIKLGKSIMLSLKGE